DSSISAARGAIRSRASSRTRSRISSSSRASTSYPTLRGSTIVEHGLDVVAVGIEHVGSVVARVVLRPQSGWAVVPAAGGERSLVEGIHGRSVGSGEGEVDRGGGPARRNGDVLRTLGTEGDPVPVVDLPAPPGRERTPVEAPARHDVAHDERHVVDEDTAHNVNLTNPFHSGA